MRRPRFYYSRWALLAMAQLVWSRIFGEAIEDRITRVRSNDRAGRGPHV